MTNTISSGEELQQLASSFQVVHATLGRLRLRTNDISLTALKTFAQIIQKLEKVREVQIHQQTGSLVVTFEEKLPQTQMLALIQQLGVSQAPAPEDKKTDLFAAWKSADFWKEQGLDCIPLVAGLAVTGGLGISGLAAIPVYMIAAGATRQAIDITKDAWQEVKSERGEAEGAEEAEEAEEAIQNLKSKIQNPYKIVHAVPGRVRFNVPRLAEDRAYEQRVQKLLKKEVAIASFRINRDIASIVINYKPSEEISVSHWLELLETAQAENSQHNHAQKSTDQRTDTTQLVSPQQAVVEQDTSEQDSISFTLLPQPDKQAILETASIWAVMKSPALNLSLAFMANFPLETVSGEE